MRNDACNTLNLPQMKNAFHDDCINNNGFKRNALSIVQVFALPVIQVLLRSQPNLACETTTPTWPCSFSSPKNYWKNWQHSAETIEAATPVHWSHVEVSIARMKLETEVTTQNIVYDMCTLSHLFLKHLQHMPLSHLGCRPSEVWKGPAFLPHSKMFGVL